MEPSLPLRMQPHGLQGLLDQRNIFMQSPMQTVPLLYWVNQEPSLPLLMELHGLQGLRKQQMTSIEEPTETVRSLWWVIMQLVLELS